MSAGLDVTILPANTRPQLPGKLAGYCSQRSKTVLLPSLSFVIFEIILEEIIFIFRIFIFIEI